MRNLFLIFSILNSLSGIAQTKLIEDTSLTKKIIYISELNSTKNKLSQLDSMAVFGETCYYESYSHHLHQKEHEKNLKDNFSITRNKKK